MIQLPSFKVISGSEWYSLEAIRAVNQAIGRVIRHKNDFGAILLMDSRFNNPAIISKLSKWLRDKIVPAKSYSESIRDLKLFFDNVPKLVSFIFQYWTKVNNSDNFKINFGCPILLFKN